ncbi:S8 family serine peptidase [Micromonospora sp. R77]|uniref:S8 family serine peptidase n=1 Tax=Micromonospora sp. R77 TaxID=2925836 RepID=UPI001F61CEB1|nr:S8 family serine peptidase [Micromonospora sp. R77]MCI4065046.1 S8 family serine peptidase [Micromonospora sp. R77]
MSRRLAAVLACVLSGVLVPVPASAAPGTNCAEPARVGAVPPWPRAMLTPDAVWPFTRGGGAVVAVLSTGVDADQPQLRGHVLPGFDAVSGRGRADTDCAGTGTQVAGVIAAQPADGSPAVGLAPGAQIQPVRVVPDDVAGTPVADPAWLARGISWAVARKVQVIVVATPVDRDTRALRDAVADAVSRGIVLVAATGTGDGADGDRARKPYPAAYDGVLGVGAVDADGRIWADSPAGDFVDLVAPGVGVPTLQRGRGIVLVDGTGVAAGFVGASAALVGAKRGDLVGPDIVRALVATASPAPLDETYGAGVVNPYAALTNRVVTPSARPLPRVAGGSLAESGTERRRRDLAFGGSLLAVLAVVGVLVMTAAARRRRWRPGLPPVLPVVDEPVEPGPPVLLLADEPAGSRPN